MYTTGERNKSAFLFVCFQLAPGGFAVLLADDFSG